MVRPRGQVVERHTKNGRTYAIRFRAYGRRRYLTLGRESEGWTRRCAEDELANVLADVRRDLWVEPMPGARRRHRKQRREIPFVVFAEDLLAERRPQLSEATVRYLEWALWHLLWLLSAAEEYGWIESNPARGSRRRLRETRQPPVYLDSIVQIEALLRAAGELDADPEPRIRDRLPLIATLVFAGLRAHELSALRWRDVDLASGRLWVRTSKTQAGLREIGLPPILRDLLGAHWERSDAFAPEAPVFPTRTGRQRSKDNIRGRILAPAIARANELLEAGGSVPLPDGLSPHKLRHTFASILVACGEDPASVMYQLGHVDPAFTLRVYAHVMRRSETERKRLRTLVGGGNRPI